MAGAGDCNCSPQPGKNEGSTRHNGREKLGASGVQKFTGLSVHFLFFFWFIDLFKYADEYFIGLFASCIVNIVAKSFTERSWQVNVHVSASSCDGI